MQRQDTGRDTDARLSCWICGAVPKEPRTLLAKLVREKTALKESSVGKGNLDSWERRPSDDVFGQPAPQENRVAEWHRIRVVREEMAK